MSLIGSVPDENAVPTPAPGLARPLRLLHILHRPGPPPARWRPAPRAGPTAARLRAPGRRLDQVGPDAGPSLRPSAGRLLRRAVQAPQPGRAVLVRRSPADHPAGARSRPGDDLPVVQPRVIRGRVDRPGPSRGAAQRRGSGGEGPASGDPNDPRCRYRADVFDDPDPGLDPRLRGDAQPRGHRRVRALDRRRARLSRRGAPGRPALPERPGRTRASASPASTATTRRRAS